MHDLCARSRAASTAKVSAALERELHSSGRLLDLLPIGVYACDRDGLIVQYNQRAAELWGRAPILGNPAVRYCGTYKAFHLDGCPLDLAQAPMREVLRSGQAVRDRELVIERPDGTRRNILTNIDPLRSPTRFRSDGRHL